MLRSIRTTTCTALIIAAALPASALAGQDLRSPDARDATKPAGVGQELRSPDARDAATLAESVQVFSSRDLRSPDTRDATRSVQPTFVVSPPAESRASGFDWRDAGIGALGGLAIFSLLSGTGVVAVNRRRAQRIPAH